MIISKAYAKRLVRQGKAEELGTVISPDGWRFMVVNRLDLQRTDHYTIQGVWIP